MRLEGKEAVNGRAFFLFLALYLILHVAIRVVVSGNAELDEAEQIVWGAQFRLGYGAELPLYTWLQAIFFHLFGTNIVAVSLLRSLLLFLVYLFTFLNAREITGSERCGVAAAASLFLIPLISWESQRILTHMVLAVALEAISIFLFVRLLRTGKIRYFLLFGLSTGLGMLAKYNFGIFLAALIIASCSIPELRGSLVNRRWMATVLIFLLVTLPPFYWIATHPDAAMAKAGRLHPDQGLGLLSGYLAGFGELAKAVAGFHLLLVPILLATLARAPKAQDFTRQDRAINSLIVRTILIGLGICALMVLFFHVTHFKSRWLLPVLFPVPLYLIAVFQERLGVRQLGKLVLCTGVVAIAVLVAMPGRIVLASYTGSLGRMNYPYDSLAKELRKGGFSSGTIVADSYQLGGNLRLRFPESRIVVPAQGSVATADTGPFLLVWDATGFNGVPEWTISYSGSSDLIGDGEVRYMEAPSLYAPGHKARLGIIFVPPQRAIGLNYPEGAKRQERCMSIVL